MDPDRDGREPENQFLEIELDPESDDLEITLESPGTPTPPPPATVKDLADPTSTPPSQAGPEVSDLPMVSVGTCPECGYALRPLEVSCPRCLGEGSKPGVSEPAMTAESASEPAAVPELPPLGSPATGRRSRWLLALVLVLLSAGLLLGGWLVWNNPSLAAQRVYKQGLAAQLQGNFEEAQSCYRRVLQLNPDFGLAAFSLGTTFLRFGDPSLLQSMESMSERAIQGDTQSLDEADQWFRETIRIADRLPPDTRLMDQNIRDPLKLRAFARACLAVTAIIRASAAIQAEQFEDAMAWLEVVSREAQAAVADDPGNAIASEALRNLRPLGPGG